MKLSNKVSSQIRKCRKAHFNKSQMNRHKRMSSSLSKPLRQKHLIRSLPVCTGDSVRVISGKYKGHNGKVTSVSRRNYSITVENCERMINNQRVTEEIHPSNVRITSLNLERPTRLRSINKKSDAIRDIKEKKIAEEVKVVCIDA